MFKSVLALGIGAGMLVLVSCGGVALTGSGCTLEVSGVITSATTWANSAAACDVFIKENTTVNVKAALTIQPGAVVKFAAKSGLLVLETGSLNAVGTVSNRISLVGTTNTQGFWKGIGFRSNDPANELTYVDVLNAGGEALCCDYFESADILGAVVLGGATLSSPTRVKITQSTIGQSGGYGVYLFENALIPGFSTNVFRGNKLAPVSLHFSAVGNLDTASAYSGVSIPLGLNDPNAEAFVRVLESKDSTAAQTVKKIELPYRISAGVPNNDVEIKGPLTINPGVKFEFEADTGLQILETASLNATGTASDRITFTGKVAAKGYWKGLAFRSNGNTLAFVDVSFAGSSAFCCDYFSGPDVFGAVLAGGATLASTSAVSVTNSSITQTKGTGLYKFNPATITQSGNTFSGNDTDKNF